MQEEWRDVPGYEGVYQISLSRKEGRCRKLVSGGKFIRPLSNIPRKDGRIYWVFNHNCISICHQAARWIALAYPELVSGKFFEGAVIDHINTDPLDNRPENLRWCTQKENINNPLTLEHMKKPKKRKPKQ